VAIVGTAVAVGVGAVSPPPQAASSKANVKTTPAAIDTETRIALSFYDDVHDRYLTIVHYTITVTIWLYQNVVVTG
jgi:hypothetical protein